MFYRFIEAYRKQGLHIDMVIYQNEAYSYTPYPGCAWTAEGTVRFSCDYLAPTLHKFQPDVHLYFGTFNTIAWIMWKKSFLTINCRIMFLGLACMGITADIG